MKDIRDEIGKIKMSMTELEGCVLAVICREGPLTAYQVRMQFEDSQASSWRASTGSIYPLIKRLLAQKLIEGRPIKGDRRGSLRLTATAAGKAAVAAWLSASQSWLGDVSEDPIRTRVYFLAVLSREHQQHTLETMIDLTRQSLKKMDVHLKTLGVEKRKFERIAHEGARMMLAGRLKWLEAVQSALN